MVRKRGLEPRWIAPPAPKAGASANSATFAYLLTSCQSGCYANSRPRFKQAALYFLFRVEMNITNYVILCAMTGSDMKRARRAVDRTQAEAAAKLNVTQAYLSMLERGRRPVPRKLEKRVAAAFKLPPTMLPLSKPAAKASSNRFKAVLGRLGYSGFAYLKGAARMNPAALLLAALDAEDLDARVVEGLPWVALRFPELDWDWLASNARLRNRQNRLAFVVSVATAAARNSGDSALATTLDDRRNALEKSRLAGEDTLCRQSMTQAERRWLRVHRTAAAKHWNLLTDLSAEHLGQLYA